MRQRAFFWALAFVLTAPHINGCEEFKDSVEERAENQARTSAPGQIPEEPPVQPPGEIIEVNRVQPNRSELAGGVLVEVVGLRFPENANVFFGGLLGENTEWVSETKILTYTPKAELTGVYDVRVSNGEETGMLEDSFEYYEQIVVESVTPQRGPTTGGTLLTVIGTGFTEDAAVAFNDGPDIETAFVDTTKIIVTTPPLPWGVYDVMVTNRFTSDTGPSLFSTFDPLRVVSVLPAAGPATGGNAVSVYGEGFVEGSFAFFGAEQLDDAVSEELETRVDASVPTTAARAEGAVSAMITNPNGSYTLPGAYFYYDETDPSLRIIGVIPDVGLIQGGASVTIAGAGFDDPTTAFSVDGLPLENCSPDANDPDHLYHCTMPAHAKGEVDMTVTTGTGNFTLSPAFTYLDLRLDVVAPVRGAIAGGTFVRVYGSGLSDDTEVFFGMTPAREVALETPGDDAVLTMKSPPGQPGAVAVTILRAGIALTSPPDAFTYFDPLETGNGTSGERIDGSVNVTVIDGETGGMLTEAFVMIGADPTTPHQGLTDARGQITLSGPDVLGPLSVSAGKAGYQGFTWVEVDAENLMMVLIPFPPPPQQGPGPPGALPALVRGKVKRIKDEWNTGSDIVVVTTTYRDFSVALPDPDREPQVLNQGEYEIYTRLGDVMLIALAGEVTTGGALEVHAMGFYPFLFLSEGETREGIDIVVDTPVDRPLEIMLDDPPLRYPDDPPSEDDLWKPDTTSAFIFYDFGHQGLHPMGRFTAPATDVLVVPMPRQLPPTIADIGRFTVSGGVYFGAGLGAPLSEVYSTGHTNTIDPVVLTPMLGTQREVAPDYFGFLGDPMSFRFSVNKTTLPTHNAHFIFEGSMTPLLRWIAVSAGNQLLFELPIFPEVADDADLPEVTTYYWQMLAQHAPGVMFNQMSYYDIFAWQSRAVQVSAFIR